MRTFGFGTLFGMLLCAVLTSEQYCQLMQLGYIDIPSPRYQERIYRVPRGPGLVRVIEQGRQTASLCLQPLERVPDADIVVMHKLMIEADEETYLLKAHRFAPLCISYREDGALSGSLKDRTWRFRLFHVRILLLGLLFLVTNTLSTGFNLFVR
jgi:hypothetical protein